MLVGIICAILIGASIGAATGYFGGSSNSKGISSNIDVDNVGEYDVIYNSVYKGRSVTKTRKVEVFDVLYNITPNELTDKEK